MWPYFSLSVSLCLSHTHTHVHSCMHTCTPTHTHTHSRKRYWLVKNHQFELIPVISLGGMDAFSFVFMQLYISWKLFSQYYRITFTVMRNISYFGKTLQERFIFSSYMVFEIGWGIGKSRHSLMASLRKTAGKLLPK
jgi:hypothetical protein